MKVKISDIEKHIDYKLKREFSSIGLDIAETTGICILTTDKEFVHLDSLVISFKTDNDKEKYNTIVKMFDKIIEEDMYVIVEDVYLGPSPKTPILLSRYGGFAISSAVRKGLEYEIIGAKSARSKFKIKTSSCGKGKSKQAVAEWVKSLNVDITDNNIADGFVLALLGLCEGMDFRSQTEIKNSKKSKKSKKKPKKKNGRKKNKS